MSSTFDDTKPASNHPPIKCVRRPRSQCRLSRTARSYKELIKLKAVDYSAARLLALLIARYTTLNCPWLLPFIFSRRAAMAEITSFELVTLHKSAI